MKRKIKNTILKTFISIVFVYWALSVLCFDSLNDTQFILCSIATLILGAFVYANKELLERM